MESSQPTQDRLESEFRRLSGESTWLITHGRAMWETGQKEQAVTDFAEAGKREERIAPLLDLLGREREAAVHRISGGSCYEKAGEFSRAVNLFRAALASPLPEHTRRDVEEMLSGCLSQLAETTAPPAWRAEPKAEAVTA